MVRFHTFGLNCIIMRNYAFHWQYKYQITVYNANNDSKRTHSSDNIKDIIDIYLDKKSEGVYFRFLKNK